MLSLAVKCQCSAKCHRCNIGRLGLTAAMRDPALMELTLLNRDIQSAPGTQIELFKKKKSTLKANMHDLLIYRSIHGLH